ncbi:MAG: urease accessory protein UreE [Pseudolabrys sp.]
MPRAAHVIAAAERRGREIADTLILDYAKRSAGAFAATGLKGGAYDIALAEPRRLHTDDLLELDDGTLIEVVAAPEPLIEARAGDLPGLMRLAYHLGDRHVSVEVLANRVRVQREPALEALLGSLGARLAMIDAPFEPEGGAYAASHGHDGHRHGYGHGHGAHHHHDH